MDGLFEILGGKGSGNWGHSGRPGKRGGSGRGKGKLADSINGVHGNLPDCSVTNRNLIEIQEARARVCLTEQDKARVERAIKSHKPSTKKVQKQAIQNEIKLSKGLRKSTWLSDNEPYDVIIGKQDRPKHLIEVKTIVRGKNDKITMHPKALRRKLSEAKKQSQAKVHTVVFDDRTGKMYYKEGVGSFRLTTMKPIRGIGSLKKIIK